MSSPLPPQPPRLIEAQQSEHAPSSCFEPKPFTPNQFTGRFCLTDWRPGERVEISQRSVLSSPSSGLWFIVGLLLAPFPILWMIALYAFLGMIVLLFGLMGVMWAFSLPGETFKTHVKPEYVFALLALSAVVVLYRVARDLYLRAKNFSSRGAIFDWKAKEASFFIGRHKRTVGFSQIKDISMRTHQIKRLNLAGMLEHAPETSREEFYCEVIASLPQGEIIFLRTLGTDLSTGAVSSMLGILIPSLEIPYKSNREEPPR